MPCKRTGVSAARAFEGEEAMGKPPGVGDGPGLGVRRLRKLSSAPGPRLFGSSSSTSPKWLSQSATTDSICSERLQRGARAEAAREEAARRLALLREAVAAQVERADGGRAERVVGGVRERDRRQVELWHLVAFQESALRHA